MENVTPKVSTAFEVGAILVDQWGCEQTNVDFYCIVKRAGQFVTLAPMIKYDNSQGDMISSCGPVAIDTAKPTIRKKIKTHEGVEYGFSLRDYAGGGWCRLWEGRPETATHYA